MSDADLNEQPSLRPGKDVVNYFSGSPLNRVAFLREDHSFLSAAFTHASSAFVVLNKNLAPLVKDNETLAFLTSRDISGLGLGLGLVGGVGGSSPFERSEEDNIKEFVARGKKREDGEVGVLFLGLDESGDGFAWKEYKGRPYFGVYIGDGVGEEGTNGDKKDVVEEVRKVAETRGLSWLKDVRGMTLCPPHAAIYALSRHLLDWNLRNPFCATCGSPTLPIHAGWKRICPPSSDSDTLPAPAQLYTLPASKTNDNTSTSTPPPPKDNCSTRTHISNVSFPRTDPTVIAAVISPTSRRILLGRQKRWPKLWYSTLAGFVEPGESLEEAVRREVWEESGVTVDKVVLHSSQPWPFPGGLMVGCLAIAATTAKVGEGVRSGEEVHLGHDPELEDARWFDLGEVEEALRNGAGGLGEGVKEGREGMLRVPPRTAIANRLIEAATRAWDKEIGEGEGGRVGAKM